MESRDTGVAESVSGINGFLELVANPDLEEIWVNGPNQVFVAEQGVSRAVPLEFADRDIRGFVERVLRNTGRPKRLLARVHGFSGVFSDTMAL